MTYEEAKIAINRPRETLRGINGIRFPYGRYEYRIRFEGKFDQYVCLQRRKIGTRNFKHFDCFETNIQTTIGEYTEGLQGLLKEVVE